MTIRPEILNLSTTEIVSLLSEYDHIRFDTIETRKELNEVLQLNINDGLIDEIELLIIESGN